MIDLTLHRRPPACHPSEVRVTERLRTLADSPQPWTAIRSYYYEDSQGTRREGDFLVLDPGAAGGGGGRNLD